MATLTNVISNATGNVGIGTTSTATKLQVYSTTGTAQIFNQLQLTNMGGGNNGDIVGIGFAAGESTQYGVKGSIGFVRTTSYGRGDITFYTNNTAGTETVSTSNERMRIDSSGNILIGVNGAYNSSRLLQVKDGLLIGNSFYTFASIDTNSTADLILSSNAGPANLGSNSNIIFKLGTSAGGGPDEKMRIVSDGNVGIGTTSPLQKLHVLGNISTISQVSSGEETNRLQFYNIGAATYDIASIRAFVGAGQANRGELGFYVNNGASQQLAMYIDRSQNVGIGTASPANTVKLDVVGNIRTSTGILFGTDTAAANLLDDYEEGTWTPVYSPTAGAFTTMPSVGSGKYRKIGDTVFFWIDLRTVGTVVLGTASGDIQITGFPFTCSAAGGYGASSIFQQFNLAAAFTNLGIIITGSTTIARITKNSSNTSVAYVQANELSTATGNFENLIGVIGMYNV